MARRPGGRGGLGGEEAGFHLADFCQPINIIITVISASDQQCRTWPSLKLHGLNSQSLSWSRQGTSTPLGTNTDPSRLAMSSRGRCQDRKPPDNDNENRHDRCGGI